MKQSLVGKVAQRSLGQASPKRWPLAGRIGGCHGWHARTERKGRRKWKIVLVVQYWFVLATLKFLLSPHIVFTIHWWKKSRFSSQLPFLAHDFPQSLVINTPQGTWSHFSTRIVRITRWHQGCCHLLVWPWASPQPDSKHGFSGTSRPLGIFVWFNEQELKPFCLDYL